jgi:hypothetical protein
VTRALNQLMEVTYPNGVVAYSPVFEDGTYYGRYDVEHGLAVAEVSMDCPLERYHAWLSHSPSETLEAIEQTFGQLLRVVGPARTRQILEELSTPEVYTHFRRWEDL